MNNRPMIFLNCDCGCSGNYSRGRLPIAGCLLNADAYLTLPDLPKVQLLGVGIGAKSQSFLKPTVEGTTGYLYMDDDGGVEVLPPENSVLTLPESSSPKALMVLQGAPATAWKKLTPPASGDYTLHSVDGVLSYRDSAEAPAFSSLFNAAEALDGVEVFGMLQTGSDEDGSVYAVKKLFSATDAGVYLKHVPTAGSIAEHSELTARAFDYPYQLLVTKKLKGVTAVDAAITDGFDLRPNSGTPYTTGRALIYDSTTFMLYRAPDPILETGTNTTTVSISTSYVNPSPHLLPGTLTLNYPTLYVSFSMAFLSQERVVVGFFSDGTLLHEWDFRSNTSTSIYTMSVAGAKLLTGLTLGSHAFQFRVQCTRGASILFSTWSMFSVR